MIGSSMRISAVARWSLPALQDANNVPSHMRSAETTSGLKCCLWLWRKLFKDIVLGSAFGKHGYLILDLYQRFWPDILAIYLQEAFVLFAANFIRWAARLFGRPSASGRKHPERAQVRRQTPGAGSGACFGTGHPGCRRQVVKVQRAERLCRPVAQNRR